MRREAQDLAEKSWKAKKGPMALYSKCVAVYAGYIMTELRPLFNAR